MKTNLSRSVCCSSLRQPKLERRFFALMFVLTLSVASIMTTSCSTGTGELKKQVEQLSNRLGVLEDTQAIRNLHNAYGYYIDKCLYEDVVDLFADDGEVHFMGGIYRGKEKGVRRLYVGEFLQDFTGGKPGPVPGFLLDHLQLQDVIHVAPDGKTAKARFRCFMQAGAHESSKAPIAESARKLKQPLMRWWEGGIYENSYAKVDGVWKIQVLNYNPLWHADYATGWGYTKPNYVPTGAPKLYPENPKGPDAVEDPLPTLWPDTRIVPFHYGNPVTGNPIILESPRKL
jgi:hypothetical protein